MESTFIYSLIDPRNGDVRYIGKSDKPKERLSCHLSERLYDERINKHKVNWLKSLIKENLKPELFILDQVNIDDWKFWEQHYISLYRSFGFNLVNLTVGGDGSSFSKHSIESRLKMSIGLKTSEQFQKTVHSKEYSDKMSFILRNSEIHKKAMSRKEVGEKIALKQTGRIKSKEEIEKIRQGNLNRKRTQEDINKQRETIKNKIIICEYCKKQCQQFDYNVNHGEKCKENPNISQEFLNKKAERYKRSGAALSKTQTNKKRK